MKKRLCRYILVLAAVVAVALPCAGVLRWELVSPAPAVELAEEEYADVRVDNGTVYITVNRPVQVKVLTIVGQLIANDNLQPGTSRLRLTAKGIYILKIGSVTKRISI